MKNLILIATVIFLLWNTDARAEEQQLQQPVVPKVTFKQKESHNFNDLKLKGQIKKPDIAYIYKRKGIRSEKIIALPEDFNSDIRLGAGMF